MSNNPNETHTYITRGAIMQCDNGSHPRKLNLYHDHGWFIQHKNDNDYRHPIANSDDYQVNVNIEYFGVCHAEASSGNENVNLYLQGSEGESVYGPICIPQILSKWFNTKTDVNLDGANVLTEESCLVCECGGIITFASSGLEYEGDLDK